MKQVKLSQTCRFEAAHHLPMLPEGHRCRNIHGHNYKVVAVVAGFVDARGVLMDFCDIEAELQAACNQLDHRLLNDIVDNPTAENLSEWLWEQLSTNLPQLIEVQVHENENSACYYTGA